MASNILEHHDTNRLQAMSYFGNGDTFKPGLDNIIVAIPAYNEEVAVGSIIARCKKYVDNVVVVDDGSKDHTAEVAELLGARVIAHKKNGGYGASIRTCFEAAKKIGADAMVILDADGQHNPDDIPLLIDRMNRTGSDIVIGSRFADNEGQQKIPAYRKVGMKVLDVATAVGTGLSISDSQSGFRAYSKKAIESIELDNKGMAAGSEILIQAANKKLKISEIPISVRYDIKDTSSENPVKHGFSVLGGIVRLVFLQRPLLFFGITGLLLIMSGVIFIFLEARALSVYVDIAVVYGTMATFSISLGIISLLWGVILTCVYKMKHRMLQFMRDFLQAA